ncbi:MAG: hypothetical protein NTW87_16820 [Planctomycetota bacterium]|nr:hypothetical protein [Planctomycetota bacterium]
MEVWLRRLFWVFAFAIGAGGTLLFAVWCVQQGPPVAHEGFVYVWPVVTTVLAVAAYIAMRRAWRETPADWRGRLQWRLADLLAVSMFTGALLTTLSVLRPEAVVIFVIPVSLLSGFGLLAGLLVGARIGLSRWERRYLYAAGFSLRLLGLLGVAALVLLIAADMLTRFSIYPELLIRFTGLDESRLGDKLFFLLLFGVPFALLVVGHVVCHVTAASRAGKNDATR